MRKIKAFTLMELMIGMIIGSIVVGFCYSGYRVILKQYYDYKKTKSEVNETMQLATTLATDFAASEAIVYKDNMLIMSQDSAKKEYEFSERYIIRSINEIKDTFHFAPKELVPVFMDNTTDNIIKDISFKAEIMGEVETFYYTKSYSAEFLMQHQKQEHNGN